MNRTGICPSCNREFFVTTTKRDYCCNACAKKAWRNARKIEHEKACICGKTFITTDRRKIYCSQQCNWDVQNAKREFVKVKQKVCLGCGTEFEVEITSGVGNKYCTKVCQSKAQYERSKARKNGTLQKARKCEGCGAWITEGRSHKRFCTEKCQKKTTDKLYRERKKKDPEWVEKEKERNKVKNRLKREYKKQHHKKRLKDPEYKDKYLARTSHARKRRRALLMNAEGSHTQEEWEILVALMNGICPRCKKPTEKFTEDHIVPLSKKGTDFIENIQPLCLSCNSTKCNYHSRSYI